MNMITVNLEAGVSGFAEDKDEAKRLRTEVILPALEGNNVVAINFSEVKYSTQSFVHALIGEVLQRFGESALDKLEFRSCAPQVKSLVQLVVDYSLGGFSTERSDITSNDEVGVKRSKPARRGSSPRRIKS